MNVNEQGMVSLVCVLLRWPPFLSTYFHMSEFKDWGCISATTSGSWLWLLLDRPCPLPRRWRWLPDQEHPITVETGRQVTVADGRRLSLLMATKSGQGV